MSRPSPDVPSDWSKRIRQLHRWLSMAFTVAVIVNVVAMIAWGQDESAVWVGLLALLPLVLLQVTGLYLFVLPYAARWRSRRRPTERVAASRTSNR